MTGNGQAILDLVRSSSCHPTAEDIYQMLRESGRKTSLATVYNNLNALCARGQIRRLCFDGKTDRFDKLARHDHLICRRCGSIRDLYLPDLTAQLARDAGTELEAYDLKLFTLCEKCKIELQEGQS